MLSLFAFAKRDKVLQIFRNGEVIQEYNVADIDYIEVNDLIEAPEEINASVSENQITIKWGAVDGATYNVYRSPDNVEFTLIASELTQTTYTDSQPLSGSNFYRVKAVVNGVESGYTSTATATITSNELESGVYLGIIGFNEDTYSYPISRLDDTSVDGFYNFVDGLTMKNGTLLYSSVEDAINAMQSSSLPSDLTTAAIVTFTDGLDQGSMMTGSPYDTDKEYLEGINKRLRNETVAGLPITAYSIGLRGKDVTDISMFRSNLAKLSNNPTNPGSEDNAFEVSNMSEVNTKFKEIAEQLSQISLLQNISVKIPGLSNGTLVRFTFDNASSANNSKLYIEGRFNLKERSLEDVQYVGLNSTSGAMIKGKQDGIFVSFTFEDVSTKDNTIIKGQDTDEWTYIVSNSSWQINSEFDKTENTEILTERSSAVIMLVLDCSSSLANDFTIAKENARDFIKVLKAAANPSLYITGDGEFLNGRWNPETPDRFRVENGWYVYEVNNLNHFRLSTSCGDWELFDSGSLGCDYGDTPGVEARVYSTLQNITCPWWGDYVIKVSRDLSTIILSTTTPNPSKFPSLYLRGEMNSWGRDESWKLENFGNGIFRFVCSDEQCIRAGEDFKVADTYWEKFNIGTQDNTPIYLNIEQQVYNNTIINHPNMYLESDFNGVLWLMLKDAGGDRDVMVLSNDKSFVPEWIKNGYLTGSEDSPLSVTAFMSQGAPAKYAGIAETYVIGYIVGTATYMNLSSGIEWNAPFTGMTNILIADSPYETDINRCIPVQLHQGDIRTILNLKENPNNLGHRVILCGSRETYFSVPGLKTITSYEWVGEAPIPDGGEISFNK